MSKYIIPGIMTLRPPGDMTCGLVDMVNALGMNNLVAVEIGSYRGESASIMLSTGKICKLYCVDPWKSFIDHSDYVVHSSMGKVEKMFDLLLSNDTRVVKFKGTINLFKESYSNLAVDFFYIDGNHEEAYVDNDITLALSFNPRIAICGHDYLETRKSIHKFFGKPDMLFSDSSWLKWMKNMH